MAAKIVFSTTDSKAAAHQLALQLVSENLAACVNIIPNVSSVYKWKGELEEAAESLLVMKTKDSLLPALLRRIKELHTYEVPEAVAISIESGLPEYLAWIGSLPRGD